MEPSGELAGFIVVLIVVVPRGFAVKPDQAVCCSIRVKA